MCGIAFLFDFKLSEAECKEKVSCSLKKLVHRGPDDTGILVDSPAVIGHRRLAILDIDASQQPMSDPSGHFVLTYNGEIYNFRELRAELQSKWTFRTRGDTEVVLAGLATQGAAFLSRMEGMWALALWNRNTRELFLARDRMGKKPLYYQRTTNGIVCASELPALSCLVNKPWNEDIDSTADYLKYGFYLPGKTAYIDVFEVLPGHYLMWQPDIEIKQTSYWSLPVGSFSGTKEQARVELREALIDAVRHRMVADVEVGAFLSGGIDSSLIVSILSKELNIRPRTFTIGFEDTSFDERSYARQVSKRCDTPHYEETLIKWDRNVLEKLVLEHVGQPFADSSILPTAAVSGLAAGHVKVALSGDGGDELFGGYQRYQARVLLRWYMRLPRMVQRNIEKVIRSLPEPTAHHSRSLVKKAHLFVDTVHRQQYETPYIAPTLWSYNDFSALAPDCKGLGHAAPSLPEECCLDDISAMMTADSLIYLPQDILVKVDRASMAHSLEARAPFLDKKLVELAFSLPSLWHRRGLSGKHMLKESFYDLLPAKIWRRRKQGFGVPVHSWFREELGSELGDLLEQTESPLNKPVVYALLQDHRSFRRDNGNRLWCIYLYLLWKQKKSTPGY